jgi:hypothetical protein
VAARYATSLLLVACVKGFLYGLARATGLDSVIDGPFFFTIVFLRCDEYLLNDANDAPLAAGVFSGLKSCAKLCVNIFRL